MPTNRPEQLYASVAKDIFSANTIAECKASFKSIVDGLQVIGIAKPATFKEAFADLTYYSSGEDKPLIAYIFDRMHQDPFESTPTVEIYSPQDEEVINRTYEIEHIAPVSTWESIHGSNEELNSIGNLLILTKKTNQLVGNLELDEKIKIYKDRHCDNLEPVKDFVNWAKEEGIASMSPVNISERARSIAQKAYRKIWNPWR